MKKLIILLVLAVSALWSQAQQLEQWTQYYMNEYMVNPAVTGADEYYHANALYRNQWVGIQDAPREVLGLESDFLTLQNRDKFEDHLTNILIKSFQETHVSKNIQINFVEIDDKEICIVNIKRAVSVRYVDTRDKNGNLSKKLYTRINNSTREVPIDEVASFVDNW